MNRSVASWMILIFMVAFMFAMLGGTTIEIFQYRDF
jgi:hypothetical protein